ncbi:uncharacterized protein E0L32_004648 [Thyridium curvatum]|uniref:Uncharacterized protein n=1 Tax=Thyridium curvatum TaxID=1093900 RepID=A0A507BEJ0_9PEZI|nr:uncharacterized protein E0L32_004648 [Thyridium curvatum]TPX15371.1 hypothetical protein E0L32_004648 [Thyridium curvatum]
MSDTTTQLTTSPSHEACSKARTIEDVLPEIVEFEQRDPDWEFPALKSLSALASVRQPGQDILDLWEQVRDLWQRDRRLEKDQHPVVEQGIPQTAPVPRPSGARLGQRQQSAWLKKNP